MCIDTFEMPNVAWDGKEFDCMAVCVDRHSGWCVVTPHTRKGLTAKVVAMEMYTKWWDLMGIPSIITSDKGPQFV